MAAPRRSHRDRTVPEGQAAIFTAAATGSGVTYQWQRSAPGASSFSAIAGATSASYATPATALADSGARYRLVAATSGGSATSASATLTVLAGDRTPPVISAIAVSDISTRSAVITPASRRARRSCQGVVTPGGMRVLGRG